MSNRSVELHISAYLSNHNSEQDKQDYALWTELNERIRELCADPKYDEIALMVNGW